MGHLIQLQDHHEETNRRVEESWETGEEAGGGREGGSEDREE